MTDETLKPCPFCGSDDIYIHERDDSKYSLKPKTIYSVQCGLCEASSQWSILKDHVIRMWNRRICEIEKVSEHD